MFNIAIPLGLRAGNAGLGVPDPSDTACGIPIASQSITGALTESLVERSPLNTVVYSQGASQIQKDCRRDRMIQDKQTLEDLKAASSSLIERRRMDRATETGAWLTVIPGGSMELTFQRMSFGTVYCCVSDSHPTLFPTDVKAASSAFRWSMP